MAVITVSFVRVVNMLDRQATTLEDHLTNEL